MASSSSLSPCCFQCMLLITLLLLLSSSQSLCLKFGSRIINPDPSPQSPLIAPAPTSGGDLPKLPSERSHSIGYPLQKPASGPATSDAPSSESYPFINSNPAVPLPSDVTDSASFLPLPSRGNDPQAVGKGALMQIHVLVVVFSMILSFFASA